MIRKIVIAIVCFAAVGLNAQEGTASPYSYFGIGTLGANKTVENQMMGGIGMYTDSIHVNLQNPAAYGKLRLTAYTAGASYNNVVLKSATEKENNQIYNLDYLSLGFQIKKGFGIGLGLQRYTAVGYDVLSTTVNSNDAEVVNSYSGTGGLNKVYFSVGYELLKSLTIGVTANYNFGTIDSRRAQIIENVQLGVFDNRSAVISGYDVNFALNYTPQVTDKHTLYTSVRVNTQANLTSENTRRLGSFSASSNREIEASDVDLEAAGLKFSDLKIPAITTLGLGYGENKKWFLGAEYSFQKLSTFKNDFVTTGDFAYQDASIVAVGGYFIPDYSSFTSYFKRVTYRAGLRMEQTGMLVNNTEINNFGITFGLGLPLGSGAGGFSNVNLGFEVGKKGTTNADLIQENYFKVNIGLSLNDRWFVKSKIN